MANERSVGNLTHDGFTAREAGIVIENLVPGKYELDVGREDIKISRVSRHWIQKDAVTLEDVAKEVRNAASATDD